MNDVILKLCVVRNYRAHESDPCLYVSSENKIVTFYFIDVFSQEYMNTLLPTLCSFRDRHIIVLCDKQKKLKVPLDSLSNIEVHILAVLSLQLIPNKFCARFEKLQGDDLILMKKHYDQLPILLTTDPMARIYGLVAGDITKIYRLDGSIYFRRLQSP